MSCVSDNVMVFALPNVYAQTRYVQLKNEAVSYSPKGYFISGVVDDRTDKSLVGEVADAGKKERIATQGGVAEAMKAFLDRDVIQNSSTLPVVLHIEKVDAQVKRQGSTWSTDVTVLFTFYTGDKKLVDFTIKGREQSDEDPAEYIEGFIRKALENDLKKFDTWWSQNKGNVATSSDVKVNVTVGRTTDRLIVFIYSLQRPLAIPDFVGVPQEEVPELAATASGIGMGYTVKTQNGQLVIDVTVTPYFDRHGSWFKNAGKNPRVLAHEQAHFDITAIKACDLVNAVRHISLTQENYQKLLDQLQAQNTKEAGDEQATYDDETNHGTIEGKQLDWEKKIKDQVRAS